ncbi:ABC transporter G family member 5 [Linum grandiflorum]
MKKQGFEIEASGITYTIPAKPPSPAGKQPSFFTGAGDEENLPPAKTRHVLSDVSLTAKPWEIMAIVGPSGAGKSTLLSILAGKIAATSGSVLVNGSHVDDEDRRRFLNKISGYVTQRDTLFPLLTVEETLTFIAKLRIPDAEIGSRVGSLIEELGLSHVAHTRVGDESCRVRGISGGERRRVSIGVGVIHDPRVLILDEPTSGLDSSSALQIVGMLKAMAETRGRTIVVSIHQPGFRIIKLFGSIFFMADGSGLFQGSVDQLGSRMRSIGLEVPGHVNVVEFAMESIDSFREAVRCDSYEIRNLRQKRTEKCTLQQLFDDVNHGNRIVDEETAIINVGFDDLDFRIWDQYPNSWFRETVILTHRFSKNIYRTKELFAGRSIQMLISGLVLGSVFSNVKQDLVGAREQVGLFAFILTFLLSCTTEALPIFLQELEIFKNETSSKSYRVSSYAVANSLVYLPFLLIQSILFSIPVYFLSNLNPNFKSFAFFLLLIWLILYTANSVVTCFSTLVPNFIVGNSVIQGVMGSFFLFSGYFVSRHGIPDYWIFMHYVSLFKYPFEGFLINEFAGPGKCIETVLGACAVTGEAVLKEEGYGGEEGRWRNVAIMVGFIVFYRFMGYLILRVRCSSSSSSAGGGSRRRRRGIGSGKNKICARKPCPVGEVEL